MLPSVCTNGHCILGPALWAHRAAWRDTDASLEEACLTHGPEDTTILEQREARVLGAAWSVLPAENRDRNSVRLSLFFPFYSVQLPDCERLVTNVQGGHQLLS